MTAGLPHDAILFRLQNRTFRHFWALFRQTPSKFRPIRRSFRSRTNRPAPVADRPVSYRPGRARSRGAGAWQTERRWWRRWSAGTGATSSLPTGQAAAAVLAKSVWQAQQHARAVTERVLFPLGGDRGVKINQPIPSAASAWKSIGGEHSSQSLRRQSRARRVPPRNE